MSTAHTPDGPLLSIIVPTYNRTPQLVNLLRGLSRQTLAADRFEVLVSDDGSTDPVAAALERLDLPYDLTLLTGANAGPATARNRALERVRGLFTLILNDDAIPDAKLLETHLAAHARRQTPVAVLGCFPYVAASQERPFVRLMEQTDLIFNFVSMRSGRLYDWRFFWTCNISLSTRALLAVGGFDERFPDPMCEDLELGYRLEKQLDLRILYLPEAHCLHDHDIDPDRFARRQQCLGRNLVRLCEIHPTPEMARTWGLTSFNSATVHAIEKLVTEGEQQVAADLEALRELDRSPLPEDEREAASSLATMESITRRCSQHLCCKGIVEEWIRRHGKPEDDPVFVAMRAAETAEEERSPVPELTSIIIPCIDGYEHTRDCLDSIAAQTPERHEVLVVDNGSSPETLALLRARTDIRLLEMGRNIGAPAARNRGTEEARGDALVYLDNDTRVTPGWLSGLIAHTTVNPRVGLVGPMSNEVSGSQFVDDPGYDPASLDDYARRFAQTKSGRHHYTNRLILFCLYVRREVIDFIGGFDPAFGRWGFEDDDFCLRASLLGYRLRVAGDVFVHHTGSRTSIAAGIDYSELMYTNWNTFKTKWRIDPDLPYGSPYPVRDILDDKFDPSRHVVPIAGMRAGEPS